MAARYNPTIINALLRLGELAGESQSLIDAMVRDVAQRCLRPAGRDEVRLDVDILVAHPPYLIREVLMDVWRQQGWPLAAMGFAEWESLAAMISAAAQRSAGGPRKRMFPGAVLAEIREGELYVRPTSLSERQSIRLESLTYGGDVLSQQRAISLADQFSRFRVAAPIQPETASLLVRQGRKVVVVQRRMQMALGDDDPFLRTQRGQG